MACVRRMLRWFEKSTGDSLAGEAELCDVTLPDLQDIFGVPQGDPMYDCWPVRAEHLPALSPYVPVPIDLTKFDYFVEADAG